MSSFPRRMQRRAIRSHPDYEKPAQPTRIFKDGSYSTLSAQGWRHFSAKRLAAQKRMAQILDHVIPPRRKKLPKLYRRPAKPAPSIETRQQRRWAGRKGPAQL